MTDKRDAHHSQHSDLDAIATLTRVIDDHDQLEDNYTKILVVIQNALRADRTALLLADTEGVFHFECSVGLSDKYRAAVDGHSPWNAFTPDPQAICIENVETSQDVEPLRFVILEEGIHALAFVPLIYRKQLLGKFMIYHNQPHHFSDSELQLARTIAGLFSFALAHQRIEKNLRAETQQRDLLMKEIHHRIKNNLQIVVSLLGLQGNQTDAKTRSILRDCENRVRSMAMIHEKLHNTSNFVTVDIGSYLRELSESLVRSYDSNGRINLNIRCQSAEGNVDKALYCGLLLNEIVSNSLKHGFNGSSHGELLVRFEQNSEGKYALLVKDDGAGIPEHIKLDNGSGLGLRLISMLTAQLKGQVHLDRTGGTAFTIEFP